tara:strand:- start:308 stop:949 length:642 start_codon:yes stop_codon:yes gene_type:complete
MQTLATHSPFDNIRFELCYVPSQRDAQTLVEEETLCDDEMKEDYPDAHFSFPNPDHFIHGEHEFFQTHTDIYAYMQPEYIYEQPPPVPPTHQPYASPLTSAPLTPTATVGTRFTITVDLDALPVEYMEPTFLPDHSFRHVQSRYSPLRLPKSHPPRLRFHIACAIRRAALSSTGPVPTTPPRYIHLRKRQGAARRGLQEQVLRAPRRGRRCAS